jgi:glycine betaine/proline transport system ATP-binding protein
MAPATPYVAKFTEAIDRTRVVHAGALALPLGDRTVEGEPLPADETLHALARRIVGDSRSMIPLADKGRISGLLDRKAALDLLLGPAA